MGETKHDDASTRRVILRQDGSNFAAWSRELLAKLSMKLKKDYVLANFVKKPYCQEPRKDQPPSAATTVTVEAT